MIRLAAGALEAIRAHARAAYPEECCGALLGRALDAGGAAREVVRAAVAENARREDRARRYLIGPEDVLRLEAEAARAGLEVVGFYHSHPDHPAEPSAFDREHAWPWYAYLIVSVRAGVPGEARAWRLASDRGAFEPEELVIVEEVA